MNKCIINDCVSKGILRKNGEMTFVKGYCNKHYIRFLKYGDPLAIKHVHGENRRKNPLYKTYIQMKNRCYNEKGKRYLEWGGRGIKVCDRWLGLEGFNNFCEDMGNKPSLLHSLDRPDNNGNYGPDNCKWSTVSEQNKNQRKRKDGNEITGLHYCNTSNKWVIQLRINGSRKKFGSYKSKEEAILKIESLKLEGIYAYNT